MILHCNIKCSMLSLVKFFSSKIIVSIFCKYLFKNALNPFESAYNISKDNALRVNIAEYLKNIYYRFYSKGAEYEEGYNKYNQIVKSRQVK